MARSRNIKPGFFTNDVLGELPPLARLLFAGLWTICDREGRCEDRPKKIKAEILPYDECNADELLTMLEASGFIARYLAEGVNVIQVLTWNKHQNPHVKEGKSTLPALDLHRTSTVQVPDETSPEPERAGLIPDSGFLIPDSLNKEEPTALVDGTAYRPPPTPTAEIVELYHRHLPALPAVEVLNDARKRAVAARWREVCAADRFSKAAALDWFGWFFERVSQSDFLMGRSPGKSGRTWAANFDFLFTPTKFVRVVEGAYHQGANQ